MSRSILGIFAMTLILISCSDKLTAQPKTNYRFEKINLPDGTPCYVVHGGSHSGITGITCNYNARKGVK